MHHAGALTNPQLWHLDQHNDPTILQGFKDYAATVFKGREDVDELVAKAVNQLVCFKEKEGAWATNRVAVAAAEASRPWVPAEVTEHMSYVRWWQTFGRRHKELSEISVSALSQAISISASERGHQSHKFLQNKLRNRMKGETAEKLAGVVVVKRKVQALADAAMGNEDEDEEDLAAVKAKKQCRQWWLEAEVMSGIQDYNALALLNSTIEEEVELRPFMCFQEPWEGAELKTKTANAKGPT